MNKRILYITEKKGGCLVKVSDLTRESVNTRFRRMKELRRRFPQTIYKWEWNKKPSLPVQAETKPVENVQKQPPSPPPKSRVDNATTKPAPAINQDIKTVPAYLFLEHPDVEKRWNKDMCIFVLSYYRHNPWLRACLKSIRKFGLYTVLSWDNSVNNIPVEHFKLIDAFVMKHKGPGGVVQPWLWQTLLTMPYVDYFDYVWCMSGDCYYSKPEGLAEIRRRMVGYDIICYWHDHGRVGTMSWMCKAKAYKRIFYYLMDTGIQGGIEARVHKAATHFGYTIAPTVGSSKGPIFDFRLAPDGDTDKRGRGLFGDVLGMRHLHWEHVRRIELDLPPIEKELVYV